MKIINLLFLLTALTVSAQSNRSDGVVSPIVHSDRRITVNVRAPKASEVSLGGDWMAQGAQVNMTRNDQGLWSVTTGPLEPGLSIYWIIVDGVTTPDPVNPLIKSRARTSASLVNVPGNPPELWQPRDVAHGRLEVNWEKSSVTGDTRAYYVYVPPGYDQRRSARFPVLYLLHGNNDTAAGWTDVGKANFILDNLLAEKRAVPMLIVMPWGHAVPYDGPQSNNTALVERYLLEELIPHVEKTYRVLPGRDHRAIVGLSMGGGQALQIGLGHLELFSAVGAFSSAVPGNFETRFKSLLEDPAQANARLHLLWIGCGREDPGFDRNKGLSELLSTHGLRNTFVATAGRHNFAVWRRYLAEVAPLLFQPKARSKS